MIAANGVVITKYYIHKVICKNQENGTLKYKNDKTVENKKYFKPNLLMDVSNGTELIIWLLIIN